MFEIITTGIFELSFKVLAGAFLYRADPNLAYAFAALETFKYYAAYERIKQFKAYLANEKTDSTQK